jgi:hypothetical protein
MLFATPSNTDRTGTANSTRQSRPRKKIKMRFPTLSPSKGLKIDAEEERGQFQPVRLGTQFFPWRKGTSIP